MIKNGTNGADTLIGTSDNDVINGLGDDDTIRGGNGADVLFGGDGRDRIWSEGGNDFISGGAGNDIIGGGSGIDNVKAGVGDDWLSGGPGEDKLYGETGIDAIYGGAGNDLLDGGDISNSLYGGDGDDILVWGTGPVELREEIFQSSTIDGGAGYDTLRIHSELLYYIPDYYGEYPEDKWFGPYVGVVAIQGESEIEPGLSIKLGHADQPDDYPSVYAPLTGIERIEVSGLGPVLLLTRSEVPIDYTVVGSPNDDQMRAGPGSQTLYGEDGSDYLRGGGGDDRLFGGGGNDTIYGGPGRDWMEGGGGEDTFGIFVSDVYASEMWGDRIAEFEGAGKAGGDRIHFFLEGDSPSKLQITEHSNYTTFDWTGDGSIEGLRVDVVGLKLDIDYFFSELATG